MKELKRAKALEKLFNSFELRNAIKTVIPNNVILSLSKDIIEQSAIIDSSL